MAIRTLFLIRRLSFGKGLRATVSLTGPTTQPRAIWRVRAHHGEISQADTVAPRPSPAVCGGGGAPPGQSHTTQISTHVLHPRPRPLWPPGFTGLSACSNGGGEAGPREAVSEEKYPRLTARLPGQHQTSAADKKPVRCPEGGALDRRGTMEDHHNHTAMPPAGKGAGRLRDRPEGHTQEAQDHDPLRDPLRDAKRDAKRDHTSHTMTAGEDEGRGRPPPAGHP